MPKDTSPNIVWVVLDAGGHYGASIKVRLQEEDQWKLVSTRMETASLWQKNSNCTKVPIGTYTVADNSLKIFVDVGEADEWPFLLGFVFEPVGARYDPETVTDRDEKMQVLGYL